MVYIVEMAHCSGIRDCEEYPDCDGFSCGHSRLTIHSLSAGSEYEAKDKVDAYLSEIHDDKDDNWYIYRNGEATKVLSINEIKSLEDILEYVPQLINE